MLKPTDKNGNVHPFRPILNILTWAVIFAVVTGLALKTLIKMPYESTARIPVYGDFTVSEESPEVKLQNPGTNRGTLMQYVITYTEGTDITVIWASEDLLGAGCSQSVDLYSLAEPGEYTIAVNMTVYDSQDRSVITSAWQETTLTVK